MIEAESNNFLKETEIDALKLDSNNPGQDLAINDGPIVLGPRDNQLSKSNKKGSSKKADIISNQI